MKPTINLERILEELPLTYYIIDLKTWKILKTNASNIKEGEARCYKVLLGNNSPCEENNRKCVCKQLIEKKSNVEYVVESFSGTKKQYFRGRASLVEDGLALVVYENVSDEILALKELNINNKRLSRAEKIASFGYWEFNVDDEIVVASVGACEIYGIEYGGVSLADIQACALPKYRKMLDEKLVNLIKYGEPYNVQFKVKNASNGEIRNIHSIAEYRSDKKMVFGVIHDNTDMANVQEALVVRENELKQLFQNMNSGFAFNKIVTDENGTPVDYIILDVNPGFESITGLKATEVINRRVLDVLPATEKLWVQKFGETALSGKSTSFINYSPKIDKYFEIAAYSPKKGYFAVIFTDITIREKSKLALKESLLDLELAQIISQIGNWKYDPLLKMSKWSNQMYVLLDRDVLQGPFALEDYVRVLDPSDFQLFERSYLGALDEGIPFDITIKIILDDSQIRWFRSVCRPEKIEKTDLYFLRGTLQDITSVKNAEEELNRSNKTLKTVIENIPDAVFLKDSGYRKILSNKADALRSGVSKPEDVIGKTDFDLFPEEIAQGFFEVDRRVMEDGQVIINREETVPVDGRNLITLVSKIPLRDDENNIIGLVGISRDVTEIKEHVSKVNLLHQTVEQIPLSITIANVEGTIEYVNPEFCKITGYVKEEVVGLKAGFLRSGLTDPSYYKNLWDTIKAGEIWGGEFLNKRKNGDEYWASAIIAPVFDGNNKIQHFVAIKEDITGKKQMIEELKQAKKEAEASSRLKSMFLANLSHEVRTPLTGILGFTELICTGPLEEKELAEYGNVIEELGRKLLKVVDNAIDMSKIQTGQMVFRAEKLDLNEILESLYFVFQGKSSRINFNLVRCPTGNIIWSDKEKLVHVFTNLLDNAFKFTFSGNIDFGYYTSDLTTVTVFVKDTGIGIDESKQKIIFEAFRQGEESFSRKYEGTGLGLAIVASILDKLGAEMSLKSKVGAGSVFYITIPKVIEIPNYLS